MSTKLSDHALTVADKCATSICESIRQVLATEGIPYNPTASKETIRQWIHICQKAALDGSTGEKATVRAPSGASSGTERHL